jgi:hypothetical protein
LGEEYGLIDIVMKLGSGELVPSGPASRRGLANLWHAHNREATRRLARRWAPVYRHVRLPSGQLQPRFPSLGAYIRRPASSPGLLRSRTIEEIPYWVPCRSVQQREQPPTRSGQGTAGELGLSLDRVVYLSGLNNDRWDWEPRGGPYPEALGPIYDWQEDEAGHVFIVVDGQRLYLLRDGRVGRDQSLNSE